MSTSTSSAASKGSTSTASTFTSKRCIPDCSEPAPLPTSSPSCNSGKQTSISSFTKKAAPQPLMPCGQSTPAGHSSYQDQLTQKTANVPETQLQTATTIQDTEHFTVDSTSSTSSPSESNSVSYAELYPAFWEDSPQYNPNVGGMVYPWIRNSRVMLQAPNVQPQTAPTPEWYIKNGKKVNVNGTMPKYAAEAKAEHERMSLVLKSLDVYKTNYCRLEQTTTYKIVVGKARILQSTPNHQTSAEENERIRVERDLLLAKEAEMKALMEKMERMEEMLNRAALKRKPQGLPEKETKRSEVGLTDSQEEDLEEMDP